MHRYGSNAPDSVLVQLTILQAAVFLFFRLAYESSSGSFTPQKFFYGYLIVPAAILILQYTVMNKEGYKTVPQLEQKLEKNEDATRDVSRSTLTVLAKLTLVGTRFR